MTQKTSLQFAVLATDIVCFRIIQNQLSILLGKVETVSQYKGKWALIGGLILPEETADTSVGRHLLQKAGMSDVYKEQLYTFSDIDRDPRGRVVSVGYIALTNNDAKHKGKVETKWLPVNEIGDLAYDHNKIVLTAIERLQTKIAYTNIAQYLLPKEFTMSELQNVYEIILGKGVDKRNFRKKILAVDILKDTGKVKKEGVMRPASLYSFNSKQTKVVNIL